ncbi:mechanosensitive ion channel family protein [Polymorphospora rubra]|uniref:Mechanosensitive ion channel protein MscS n=1 Tax=Polymorphospora rubra TaxID=338584 RepID=A0A810MY21_9ACTN|nr:mechanosensitive ion channel domain-containing protein [Polymorphospora rubra]BCJ64258.1 mechanosensitive ion channel protein MscS [Polymorphospora rubra]
MRAFLIVAVTAISAGLFAWLSGMAVKFVARRRYEPFLMKLHRACFRPWVLLLVSAALYFVLPKTGVSDFKLAAYEHGAQIAVIVAAGWLMVKVLFVAEDVAFRRLPVNVANNRRVRRARTQISLMRRITALVITVLTIGAVAMTYAPLRTFGASVLASAGVAGVILGFAAHTTLGNAVAGLQLAFTDALRIDDVVVVECEWGRVEEIKLTHVVVRLWDERRLMLPTSYFTTKPFQNWTRHEARVLAAVTLHLDFTAHVDEIRAETHRLLEQTALWDQSEWVLQVIDVTDTAICLRVLASASDGPSAWDLRCELREKLIQYLREKHPEWLPRLRSEFKP